MRNPNKWDGSDETRIAPDGAVWLCAACGKQSKDVTGTGGGWDESCMLKAVLVRESSINRERGVRADLFFEAASKEARLPTIEECGTCRYWRRSSAEESYGRCRRYPPTQSLNLAVGDGVHPIKIGTNDGQPTTFYASWCGEYGPEVEK